MSEAKSLEEKLAQHLLKVDKQLSNVASPYSIMTALNILKIGLQGPTRDAVEAVTRDVPKEYPGLANALFYTGSVEGSYLGMVENCHLEEFKSVDQVNAWVAEATNNKITKLFTELQPPPELVICNAIHFKESWKVRFDPDSCVVEPFYGLVKSQQKYMVKTVFCQYMESFKTQYVGIPLKNGTVFIIRKGTQPESVDKLAQVHITSTRVNLKIPKFEVSTRLDLEEFAMESGFGKIFEASSDFSPILGGSGCVSKFVHEAVIRIDENGAEAAAATGMGVSRRRSLMPRTFVANEPFRYWIYDTEQALVLFEGIFTGYEKPKR